MTSSLIQFVLSASRASSAVSAASRAVWHPAVFVFSVYIIILSSWILIVTRSSS